MNYREILACLDAERQTVPDPDVLLEATQHVVRGIAQLSNRSAVVYSNFLPEPAGQIIESEIEYFTKLKRSFEWKVYGHDQPADLLERLRQRGFKIGAEEALMMLDLRALPAALLAPFPLGVTVRPVGNERDVESFLQLEAEIWGRSSTIGDFLRFNLSDPPRRDLAFVAYLHEKPIGMGRVTASSQSQFGGLWGGSVLNEFRGRGIYRALLSARIKRAQEIESVRYLRVDALPTSRPILEKYGFNRVGSTWPATWPAE
jgi:GNAT superfamily N-acetyltransferase